MSDPRTEPRVRINPARRSLRIAGILGAGLLTGAEKFRNGFRNGDSLLIDLKHRVVAVADAGERFPEASRHLLERLEQDMEHHGPPEDGPGWQARIAALWKTQLYVEKTTLSIVAVQPSPEGCRLWITHGGDSRIAVIGNASGRIHHRSAPDMNFAGRSLQPPALQILTIDDPDARIVLATDGLNDLFGSLDDPHRPSIPSILQQPTVEEAVDAVFDTLQSDARPYDDASLIVVSPFDLGGCPEVRVLIGARPRRKEAWDPGAPADEWIALDQRPETIAELLTAGIQFHLPALVTKEQR